MRYIKSITQQKLSFLLAIYIGLFMNGAVFYRRFGSYAHDFTVWKGISAVVELAATVLVTFFLLRLLSLFGRRSWRILASLVVLFSAGASYYMTFLNVVIGYGIIASVMTTDIDLSKEVVGLNFILWLIAVSALPLILIWNNRCRYTLLRQLRTPGQRIRSLAVVVLAGIMVWAPIRLLDIQQKKVERATGVDLPSYGGVVANSYLPSNWLSALGLYAWARVDESSDNNSLLNPAKKFTYQAPQNVMTLMSCLSSVKPRVGTIWVFSAMSVIPRRNWPRRKIWRRSVVTPVIPQPNSHCVACLYVRGARKIIRSAH